MTELALQKHIIRGHAITLTVICTTYIVLHFFGKISAIPPTIPIGIIALLSFASWCNLFNRDNDVRLNLITPCALYS